jgi:23S rRNA (adenine2503-C2)-methyltransferase
MTSTRYGASLPELETMMGEWGQPAYRARQIYHHLYRQLTADGEIMTNLPRALRERLAAAWPADALRLVQVQVSDDGQTRKALFALPGNTNRQGTNESNGNRESSGGLVETVLMIADGRVTVCVSTQAGCAMGCVFCATGQRGLWRNLSSGEIVEQVIWAAREARKIRETTNLNTDTHLNVVFMGMGEPFANYDQWWDAVERLHDPQGFDLGARHMTVSTVGLVPGIRRLASESLPINLAISLHAPDDALRDRLVPVNRRYPLAELLAAARNYTDTTRRRVSFEYVLLRGHNDQPHHAHKLARLLRSSARQGKPLLFHVNLIPWNAVFDTTYGRPHRQQVLDFQAILQEYHIACTVRVERGGEIAAACGQLAGTPGTRQTSQASQKQERSLANKE